MTPAARCYTTDEILALLKLSRRTFFKLKAAGQLPMLDELRPRLGRRPRYRAALVDRWLAGEWEQSRYFAAHRRKGAA